MFRNLLDSFKSKPKNKFSLENFNYLYLQLVRHPVIHEQNKGLIVETLRQIAELLIWGDQHESEFFDFFLEHNIMSFFMKILNESSNTDVQIQLIQTLSILIENIKNKSSIYYLLSNNHLNSMISNRLYDFSDEELLAYYISLLKTLSLSLDKSTLQFFYNDKTNEFPLYTQSIRYFNHKEGMIRIAVRTITLNIFKVEDASMRSFLLTHMVSPYFHSIVYYVRDQCSLLDHSVIHSNNHMNKTRLEDFVAELMDFFYYLQDIFDLGIGEMSVLLADQLLNHLFLPQFIASLLLDGSSNVEDRISPLSAVFLLTQSFSIFSDSSMLNRLAAELIHPSSSQYLILPTRVSSLPPVKRSYSTPNIYPQTSRSPSFSSFPSPILPPSSTSIPSSPSFVNSLDSSLPFQESISPSETRTVTKEGQIDQEEKEEKEDKKSEKKGKRQQQNKYYQALMLFLGGDERMALNVLCLLYAILKSSNIDNILLEYSGLFPYRLHKAKRLLEALIFETSEIPEESSSSHKSHSSHLSDSKDSEASTSSSSLSTDNKRIMRVRSGSKHTRSISESIVSLDFQKLDSISDQPLLSLSESFTPLSSSLSPPQIIDQEAKQEINNQMEEKNEAEKEKVNETVKKGKETTKRGMTFHPIWEEKEEEKTKQESTSVILVEYLLNFLLLCGNYRLITLQMVTLLIKELVYIQDTPPNLKPSQLATMETAYKNSIEALRTCMSGHLGDIFLELFEDQLKSYKQINYNSLLMDSASLLLPVAQSPMGGVGLSKRLPTGEAEKIQKNIQSFLVLREFKYTMLNKKDDSLPLKEEPAPFIKAKDSLALESRDYSACWILVGLNNNKKRSRRYLLVESTILIVLEPDPKSSLSSNSLEISPSKHKSVNRHSSISSAIVTNVLPLQSIEVQGDPNDELSLILVCHPQTWSCSFYFDESKARDETLHLLEKSKFKVRNSKMQQINDILDS